MKEDLERYAFSKKKVNGEITYWVSFKDGQGIVQKIEVPYEIYQELQKFKREVRNIIRSDERHWEYVSLDEEEQYARSRKFADFTVKSMIHNIGKTVIENAIDELGETQKRRFLLYVENRLTYEQIATLEGCTKRAVKFSVDAAKKKIRKKIKNFYF